MQVLDKHLLPIFEKVHADRSLDFEDGLRLYRSNDIIGIGRMADFMRRRRHGNRAYFVYNQHLNYTNICANRCKFCAYGQDQDAPDTFTLDREAVRAKLLSRIDEPITEIHVVGGLNPELPLTYYLDLLATIREIRPKATIKAFTAVEIDHLAAISRLGLDATIARLKAAGLAMLPGGGAEVMSDRIHDRLFPRKIGYRRWLEVMRAVHRAGLSANATMLYGHIETDAERVEHLLRLRSLQSETNGFSAFIPLAFHAANTGLSHLHPTTGFDDLKAVAIARLILDNFAHIKAYWVMIGEKTAQTALAFGADDLDGTIIEEKITHTAGAVTAKGLNPSQLRRLIAKAGFKPVQRDSFYQPVATTGPTVRAGGIE